MTFAIRRFLWTIVLIFSAEAIAAEEKAGGLLFVGDHPGFTWGTSLSLPPDSTPAFAGTTLLRFDFAIWNSRQYGTILSLNVGGRRTLTLTLVPDNLGDSSYLALAWHGGTGEVKAALGRSSLGRGQWHVCELRLELAAGKIGLCIDSLQTRLLHFSPLFFRVMDIRFGYEPVQREGALFALRDVLTKAGIALVFNDDTYSLHLPERMECDYFRLVEILGQITENQPEVPERLVHDFLAFAGRGQLLDGKDHDWLEGVRTDLMCDVTRAAGALIKGAKSASSTDSIVEIAEVALLWDPLNEAAIRSKLAKLLADGLHSEAKTEFDKFTVTYQSTFNHPFTRTIQSFLQE